MIAVLLTWVGCSPWSIRVPPFLPSCVSGLWRQWHGTFLKKGLAYVCRFHGAPSPGGQACASARLGWIAFPIVPPRGRSVEFPWRGTSRVTHVTMVPREVSRRCAPLPCLRPDCLRLLQTAKWMTYSAGALLYFRESRLWRYGPGGPTDFTCASGTGHADCIPHSAP